MSEVVISRAQLHGCLVARIDASGSRCCPGSIYDWNGRDTASIVTLHYVHTLVPVPPGMVASWYAWCIFCLSQITLKVICGIGEALTWRRMTEEMQR